MFSNLLLIFIESHGDSVLLLDYSIYRRRFLSLEDSKDSFGLAKTRCSILNCLLVNNGSLFAASPICL